ncbi:hypothetical protein SH591_08410 [Sphingomonas sp. LY54]|uniref:hypothetical protein n=1 Tax=Sphingomonas sp. LY54 TaxID=3095343 RepID=UPI002D795777|nr:hypothetical protein [Sphingomonas sp. LY54]WRP27146.1 hypothetical protein SH591_08410 [Sphingomonas sp. LY54]
MKSPILILATMFALGCSEIPKDPEGTLDRVRVEGVFKVGLIASEQPPVGADRSRLLVERVGQQAEAEPQFEKGASEPLLAKLEEGKLDMVIGELAPASPWAKAVTLLTPLGEQVSQDGHVHLVVALRNGENAWIGLVDREVRAVAAMP